MSKYRVESPRIPVQFINAKTEDVLFEIKDRNWMNLGELMTAHYAGTLVETEMKGKNEPDEVLVIAVVKLIKEKE